MTSFHGFISSEHESGLNMRWKLDSTHLT